MVKRIRRERGYSQAQVTELGGLSAGHLGMVETGSRGRNVSRDIALKIARGLRATDDERDELLRLAGHPVDGDLPPTPTVEEAINTDPLLRADERRALLDLYRVLIR